MSTETEKPRNARAGGRNPAGANRRPTLKDIAFMTGLGVTTVSRALNDAPDIGKATKARVRLVADQIGYRPNRAGVRLRTGKTNVISIILNTEEEAMGLSAPMVTGISEAIGETSYHLIVTPYGIDQDPLDPVRYVVETGSADGIILSRTMPNDPRIAYLAERNFPFATHGRTRMGIEHGYFDFDNEAYARKAVAILAERGRENIGLLAPPEEFTFAHHLMSGLRTEIDARDLLEIPIRNVNTDSKFSEIESEIFRMMQSRHRPDGIVCGSAQAAISATAAIERAGFALGKDIDIVAKESFELLKRFRPEIVVIPENFRNAGRQLATIVIALIDGEEPSDHQILEKP